MDRTFAVVLELIAQGQAGGVLEQGDPERVGHARRRCAAVCVSEGSP